LITATNEEVTKKQKKKRPGGYISHFLFPDL